MSYAYVKIDFPLGHFIYLFQLSENLQSLSFFPCLTLDAALSASLRPFSTFPIVVLAKIWTVSSCLRQSLFSLRAHLRYFHACHPPTL